MSRTFAAAAVWSALLVLNGCVIGYANTVAAPGQRVPTAKETTRTGSLQLHLARNVAAGAHATATGVVAEREPLPAWAGVDVTWRHGLADGLALELRIPTSVLFPIPIFAIPNGLSLAPVWRLAPGDVEIFTSPRLVFSRGRLTASGPSSLGQGSGTSSETTLTDAYGVELPASFVVRSGVVAASLTPYVRAFALSGTFDAKNTETGAARHGEGGWYTWGGGATLAIEFTFSWVSIALAAALEAGGNPAAQLAPCLDPGAGGCEPPPSVLLAPQGGITFSFGTG